MQECQDDVKEESGHKSKLIIINKKERYWKEILVENI